MNGSASALSSATMKGTRLAINPAMNVSGEPVELGDDHGALPLAGSFERLGEGRAAIRASAPLPVSTSVNS